MRLRVGNWDDALFIEANVLILMGMVNVEQYCSLADKSVKSIALLTVIILLSGSQRFPQIKRKASVHKLRLVIHNHAFFVHHLGRTSVKKFELTRFCVQFSIGIFFLPVLNPHTNNFNW